ncbi:MAG TPA: phosphate ABC transporter substrate-binding protein PstS [Ktedonobacterales bacterium]|nr:phosphate ABC transporter substrate-binding protein PstS [Ktedonobacterales bacterium]
MLGRSHAIRSITVRLALGVVALTSLTLAACSGSNSGGTSGGCPNTNALTGAGSTFINPLMAKWTDAYVNATCGAQVTYQSVGSGAGITQFLQQTVDFGATDSPMTDAQVGQSPNGAVLHVPATIGGVAISYNVPEMAAGTHLQLTGDTIAKIFLGTIKNWNDPAIAASNTGASLPNKPITVVHRSDGSGTTGILTHYLAAVSPDWANGPGAGTTINWPTGVGAKGNDGVAAQVKNTAYAIGYNELAYVVANNISYAAVQNKDASAFVVPSSDTVAAAANSVTSIPDDLRFFFVNAPGATSYPIAGFSWLLVYQNQKDADKGQAIANFLWYGVHDGQQFASPNYVPLPANIVQKDEAKIKAMQCGGSACYKG